MNAETQLPFSRTYSADQIPARGLAGRIEAGSDERRAIARLLGAEALDAFSFEFELTPAGRGTFEVSGSIAARLTRTCVITLDAFDVEIGAELGARFVSEVEENFVKNAPREQIVDLSVRDQELLVDGAMDLGQLAYEYLAVSLDPYPRRPGTTFDWAVTDLSNERDLDTPFATLKRLKDR